MLKTWKLVYKVHAMYEDEGGDYDDTVYMYAKTPDYAIWKAGVDAENVVSIKELIGECRDPEYMAPAEDDEVVEITLRHGGVPVIVTGRDYILVNKIDGETTSTKYDLSILVKDNGRGIPGNMNPEVMCYHGFRGSYADGYSYWAEGLRTVKEIIEVTEDYDGIPVRVLVRLSKDSVPDED